MFFSMVSRKAFSSVVVLYHPDAVEQARLVESRLKQYGIAYSLVDGSNADEVSQIGTEALVFYLASEGLVGERHIIDKLEEIFAQDVKEETYSLVSIDCGAFRQMGSMFRLRGKMRVTDMLVEDNEYVLSPLGRVLEVNGFQVKKTEEDVEGKPAYFTK